MESAALQFPWRQLGEILVAEELLTEDELEQALAEQATTGRLLGQIIVNNGYLSAFSLARVLSDQHGVQLSPREEAPAPLTAVPSEPQQGWQPLGNLLVDLEFLTESQLDRALAAQREEGGRLGEILVSRGLLSGGELAQALAPSSSGAPTSWKPPITHSSSSTSTTRLHWRSTAPTVPPRRPFGTTAPPAPPR